MEQTTQQKIVERGKTVSWGNRTLVLGVFVFLGGFVIALFGAGNLVALNCTLFPQRTGCLLPLYLGNQVIGGGFRSTYALYQEMTLGGMLLMTLASMVMASGLTVRKELVLLVGVFVLLFVMLLAVAGTVIPVGVPSSGLR